MFNRFSAIYKAASSSRVRRPVVTWALALLCVVLGIAGPVLIREHRSPSAGKAVTARSRSRASSEAQPTAELSAESVNPPTHSGEPSERIEKKDTRLAETGKIGESTSAVVSESPAKSAVATTRDSDGDPQSARASEGSTSKRPVRLVVPEPPPVFSIMRTDEVKKRLADASAPAAAAELAELRDSDREDQEEEARERKERTVRRMLAAGAKGGTGSASQEPEIKGPSREELAAKGLDGVSFDLVGIKPSEYNGDVRDLRSVPVNFRNQEFEVEKPMDPAKLAAGAKASTEPFINVPLAPMPSPLQNFAGLSFNSAVTGGTAGAGWPPDVNGDVGLNHYILSVNDAYAIYNKTGTQLAAFTENSLWSGAGTGTPCDANNFGDPVVVYDQFADRWILTHFAFATVSNNPVAPYYECFAISKTNNPVTGGWWLYAVKMDTGAAGQPPAATLADYPKFGNWNDGCLYMAANGFGSNGAAFTGVVFASFNKADMESGAVLRGSLGFTVTQNIFTMIPSNISGATAAASLPTAGTPNYFVSESTSIFALEVRKFTPGANCTGGSLGAATIINQVTYGTSLGSVVPQPPPATASHNLDTLDDRLMQKVQYRRVGAAESLWVTQDTRTAGATARPQWAQINVNGGTVSTSLVQTQIYAPDATLYRWLPSIAADNQGNVALGYSTSNASSPNFPSVAYSGRLVGDPLNQLPQTEVQLIAGTGSQTTTSGGTAIHRWGDYTSMSVDPADDCTFWYAGMYYTNVGADATRNWNTRIGSFKFPGCVAACATITGTLSGGGTICNGSSSTVSVDVTGGTPPYTVKLTNNAQVQTGSAVQTHFDFTVSPTTTTVYQLDTASSHDNGSCPLTNSGSATVTVNQPPTPATVGSNQTICALGTTTGLGGNSPTSGTGTWTVVSGGTGTFSNIHTPGATFTHATGTGPVVLRWTISNSPCTDSTAQLSIAINQPPTPATVGSNQTICALGTTTGLGGNTPTSGTGTWTVVSGGAGTFNNIHTPGATFTHTSGAGPIVLRWTISNSPCADSTADVTITIMTQPTATVGGAQAICVSGTTAGLGGNTPGAGMTGAWSVVSGGTGTFSNTSTPNATFTHTSGTGPVTLRWTVSNAPCTNATADVTVTINQPPATPTITPNPASVCAGSAGNIATAPGSTSYMWSIANGTITSLTNIQAITYAAGGSGSVTLNLTVTNASGCSASNSLMVTIKAIALDLDHQSFPGNGGNGMVNVAPTDLSCAWTASTGAAYIHVTSGGAGVGNGSVVFTVDSNPGPSIRSAVILIGGQTFTVYQGIDFLDVPSNDPFYTDIGKLAARGVTLGCGSGNYCPNDPVSREQMAAFIMRAKGEFNPPTPGSQRFNDVPPASPFYNFIERMAVLNITLGCTPDHLFYCPADPVKRDSMAAFILRGLGEFSPPTPATQRFNDVPPANVFYNFVDRMAVLNITLGCTPDHLMYCPNDSVTRAQMAAFLVRAFNL